MSADVPATAHSIAPGNAPSGRVFTLVGTLALALFYLSFLVVDRAAGALYGVLVLLGCIALLSKGNHPDGGARSLWRRHAMLLVACVGPLLAVLANEISRGQLMSRNIDAPLRLALFPLVLLAISRLPLARLRLMQWCFVIAVLAAAVKIHILSEGGHVRYGTDFIPMITFAELSLLLGCFSLLSLAWNRGTDRFGLAVKCLAGAAALYCSYLSQSRGTWATIPVFILIAWFATRGSGLRYRRHLAVGVLVLLALGAGLSPVGRERAAAASDDIHKFFEGKDADTSLGFRLQLWRGSLVLLEENPLFGVGIERYPKALEELAQRGILTPTAAGFQHSHNELLFAAARLGSLGVLAMLGLIFLPAAWFARWMRHQDAEVRSVAAMGLSLCLGLFVLGLSDVVFLWWEVYPFYAISLALFACYLDKRLAMLEAGDGMP